MKFLDLCPLMIGKIVIELAFIGYGLLVALIWWVILKSSGFCHFDSMPWSSVIMFGLILNSIVTGLLFPKSFGVDFMIG